MNLNASSRYAVMAVVYIARCQSDRPLHAHVIARDAGIPEMYLRKVLQSLESAGILTSLRGPRGGYLLARPATSISLLEVVEAVEGPIRGVVSLVFGELDARLQKITDRAADATRRVLAGVSIADLVQRSKGKATK